MNSCISSQPAQAQLHTEVLDPLRAALSLGPALDLAFTRAANCTAAATVPSPTPPESHDWASVFDDRGTRPVPEAALEACDGTNDACFDAYPHDILLHLEDVCMRVVSAARHVRAQSGETSHKRPEKRKAAEPPPLPTAEKRAAKRKVTEASRKRARQSLPQWRRTASKQLPDVIEVATVKPCSFGVEHTCVHCPHCGDCMRWTKKTMETRMEYRRAFLGTQQFECTQCSKRCVICPGNTRLCRQVLPLELEGGEAFLHNIHRVRCREGHVGVYYNSVKRGHSENYGRFAVYDRTKPDRVPLAAECKTLANKNCRICGRDGR